MPGHKMMVLNCDVKIVSIGGWLIARIPEATSKSLSSRGMLMISGKLDGKAIEVPLEPDGKGCHWFRVPKEFIDSGLQSGDTVHLVFAQMSVWPEPVLPPDLESALGSDSLCYEQWQSLTVKARWEWIRWISSTGNEKTRAKRIETTVNKLLKGMKRPCCFNSSACSVPKISRAGVLLDPEDHT